MSTNLCAIADIRTITIENLKPSPGRVLGRVIVCLKTDVFRIFGDLSLTKYGDFHSEPNGIDLGRKVQHDQGLRPFCQSLQWYSYA